ncbi:MAG: sigma-54 interaction domain-containing protein [Solidesulfovibrio sp. DCME]|uniref:sigma-54 interaction domain-containing protein n=1 Tax=Solidesulfovibrio sp. DCME TaxID=3447380 RepID=UPI003D134060
MECNLPHAACSPPAHDETEARTETQAMEKLKHVDKKWCEAKLSGAKICLLPEAASPGHDLVTGIFSDEKNFVEFLKKIIDYCACGLQVVNRQGKIVFINESFKEVHGVREEDVIGRHVTDIVDNTRMHLVAQTGIPEHDRYQDIRGIPYVVSRIPIFEDGECIGAVGVIRFRYLDEVQKLTDDIKRLQKQIRDMRKEKSLASGTEYSFANILGVSEPMRQAKNAAMQAAATNATVLLRGESGVGKEVFAHSIHNYSRRRAGPFIRVNCSAIQETLVESELFGYEEGAFTGARKGGRKGRFEQADGGTIFLDEIGDMPLSAQVKLLRVIQEGEVDRLGSEQRNQVDVRIIAATNRNLEDKVRDGSFREDLFYRLNVIPILIPALRHIPEDIPWLIKSLWEKLSRRHGIHNKRLTSPALAAMQMQPWKGNVREMQNVLERIMIMSKSDEIGEEDLRRVLLQGGTCSDLMEIDADEGRMTLDVLVEKTERRAIRYALAVVEGNRSAAAKLLGISRPLFYKKLAKYGFM